MLTTLSIIGPLLVRPATARRSRPRPSTVVLSGCGLVVVIAGKLSLGRSFGLIPANRGVVSTGLTASSAIRSIWATSITHVAFVAADPTTWNLVI